MTIRKKILLFSALALGAFLAAVYLLSRFALLKAFARLESDSARETISHMQSGLRNEQSHLEILAVDYGQWDRTYNFMQSRDPGFVRTELTADSLKGIQVDLVALFDQSGRVVVNRNSGTWAASDDDIRNIEAVQQRAEAAGLKGVPLNGILELKGRLFMLSYHPILSTEGVGTARGTLVMGRELDETVTSSLSRWMGNPVWIEPADSVARSLPGTLWTDGSSLARAESDSTSLNYVAVRDFEGRTRRLLVERTPRSLHLEGTIEIRYLWSLLMLAGAVFCGALFFFVDEVLVTRIASLSSDIAKVTVSGDLALRLNADGRDELSDLARAVNSMLTAIQKAKAELLQAQESLRFHAEHDALTGVLNRRAIRDVLRKELARCRRDKNTLGIILADLDHFKKINDHHGHAAGDTVLVTAVQRISSMLRSYDSLGRYGGEEFLLIAPGCDLALAQKLAERIRSAIGDEAIDLGEDAAKVSVSLGVTLGTADSDPEFLVALADTALYRAKRNGRNRVEIGLELPEDEALEVRPR
ncbi:MAG TPA: diguanylate cyclase [Terriglobales bacterium]|jgi:diguanylate cyclase (GGDEF)-like protein|nr:diguanylate cyclase [Terriglobales bacterium]